MSTSSPDISAPVNWEELFAQQQEANRQLLAGHAELMGLIDRLQEPATVEPIQLTPNQPVQDSSAVPGTLSVGVLNPAQSILPVALGVFGSATAADAIQVNPGGLLILPIRAGIVEIAAVGAIPNGATVYAFLMRFKSVQHFLA